MDNSINYLLDTEEIDQEWVKELAKYLSVIKDYNISEKDKKLLIRSFLDYKSEGFNQLSAMKKAILIFDSLKS
ncbi:MAG: hypothetical protein MUO82_05135 [Candidatus Thermoplasmatota archaeon]|nr:hypothetical protein [Candidatus Thermoplasmatota archaeon]